MADPKILLFGGNGEKSLDSQIRVFILHLQLNIKKKKILFLIVFTHSLGKEKNFSLNNIPAIIWPSLKLIIYKPTSEVLNLYCGKTMNSSCPLLINVIKSLFS